MRRAKLKNWNSVVKKRILATICLSILLSVLLSILFIRSLANELPSYISARVKKENTILLKEAFSFAQNSSVSIDDLITVVKNSKEEITEVDFDMQKSSQLLTNITSYLNESLSEYNYVGYRLDIPVGSIARNPIFVGLAPKIPVKVELSDVALGNVRTAIKPFGINSALVEVYLDIFLRSEIIYPFAVFSADSEYSSLIASKIISGSVPSLFGGAINSKSDTINLPLNE